MLKKLYTFCARYYDRRSSTQSPQSMSERIRTLTALAQGKKGLFIVPLTSF